MKKKYLIGFYDYTVILTYIGGLAGLLGILLTFRENYTQVCLCMGISLFCDTLDGKVARRKPGRTKDEMLFGIQIDSLCDLISFGLCPAAMFCQLALHRNLADLLLLGAYCLCCVIRLAYFNTLACQAELGVKGDFHGLPVVCLNVVTPLIYVIYRRIPAGGQPWLLRAALITFGLLYILDFPVKKPNTWKLVAMTAVFCIPLGILFARHL